MKLKEYGEKKVITVEIIGKYLINENDLHNISCSISKGIKHHFHVEGEEAREFGVRKNFNYGRGLNLFPIDSFISLMTKRSKYYSQKIKLDELFQDIEKDDVKVFIEEESKTKKSDVKISSKPKPKKEINLEEKQEEEKTEDIVFHLPEKHRSVPFDEIYSLIDRMTERQMQVLNTIQEENIELKNTVASLSIKVDELLEQLTVKTDDSFNDVSIFDTPIILKEDSSYEEWKAGIKRACELISKADPSRTQSDILHEAYSRIRAQYGIVWEQEAKEFRHEFDRSPTNTRELCWWMETNKKNYKNLLIGKLNTIYGEVKRNVG